ncbi:MAG: type II toxin-antitoxin system RelE/ParE family toxin [Clostridia bacterium]|nr:type II toxin-antitoxin system RelE/ParE family toxin [Clostridia bacterium]
MKIRYAPQAKKDLEEIRDYIAVKLRNPDAAAATTRRITRDALRLTRQPYLGVSVEEKTGKRTDARILVSGKYWVVYEVHEHIDVLRILDTRMDFFRNLGSF